MNKFLVCAALGLVLATTEISAKKSCSSFKGKKCEKKGCDWSKTGDAKFKTCKDVAATAVDDSETPVAPVNASVCSEFRRGKGCRNSGCQWTKLEGNKKRTCNVREVEAAAPTGPPTSAPTFSPSATPEPIFAGSWKEEDGCCRDSDAKNIPQGTRFDMTVGANTTEAMAECEGACAETSDCTAFELTTKTKGKKKKGKKMSHICELHNTAIDSTVRATKSCKRAVCHIKQPALAFSCSALRPNRQRQSRDDGREKQQKDNGIDSRRAKRCRRDARTGRCPPNPCPQDGALAAVAIGCTESQWGIEFCQD